jgi:hypothetical protein
MLPIHHRPAISAAFPAALPLLWATPTGCALDAECGPDDDTCEPGLDELSSVEQAGLFDIPIGPIIINLGNEGFACYPGSACNGDLVCNRDNVCVDPRTTSTVWVTGSDRCDPMTEECNPCAWDVKAQLDDAWDRGGMPWSKAEWNFNWERNYAPSGREPDNVFGNSLSKHVQGFVRTYDDSLRFAGSHSSPSDNGGVYFIRRNPDGVKHLAYLHSVRHAHPSGLATIGKYIAFSDRVGWVRLLDTTRAWQNHLIEFPTHGASARTGGGLGLAKLRDGKHLLVVGPRGKPHNDTEAQFYLVSGGLEHARSTYLSTWAYEQPSSWRGDYEHMENLSVITECGTGDLYVITTAGPGADEFSAEDGFYLLSKVVQNPRGQLALRPLRAYHQDQQQSRCDQASAATAWVDRDHTIDLMCHERGARNGWLDGNDDTFRFLYGDGSR